MCQEEKIPNIISLLLFNTQVSVFVMFLEYDKVPKLV